MRMSDNNEVLSRLYSDGQMTKVYLTEGDQQIIDPTCKGRGKMKTLDSYDGSEKPTPKMTIMSELSRDQWRELIAPYTESMRDVAKFRLLYEYETSMWTKYAPQGKPVMKKVLEQKYVSSYEAAQLPLIRKTSAQTAAHEYFMQLVREAKRKYGVPQVELYTGYTSELSGLPTMTQKSDPKAERYAFNTYADGHHYPMPILPWYRDQRSKQRGINMDEFGAVYAIGGLLTAVRNWFKTYFTHIFDSWLNPVLSMTTRITKCVSAKNINVEGDYMSMDEHFSFDCYCNYVQPIFDELLPPNEANRILWYVQASFHQPVYWGEYVTIGLHNLLSGVPITQDCETYYGAQQQIAFALACDVPVNECQIFVIGDDSVLSVPRRYASRLSMEVYAELSNASHLPVSLEKCAIRDSEMIYLRKVYAPSLPRDIDGNIIGAYPLSLWANSLVNPERRVDPLGPEFVRAIQVTDGIVGHPLYRQVVPNIFGQFRPRLRKTVTYNELVSVTPERDWWEKVYGEAWTLDKSSTVKLLKQVGLLK